MKLIEISLNILKNVLYEYIENNNTGNNKKFEVPSVIILCSTKFFELQQNK